MTSTLPPVSLMATMHDHPIHDDDAPITHSHQQNENENGPETMEAIGRDEETRRDEETGRDEETRW